MHMDGSIQHRFKKEIREKVRGKGVKVNKKNKGSSHMLSEEIPASPQTHGSATTPSAQPSHST